MSTPEGKNGHADRQSRTDGKSSQVDGRQNTNRQTADGRGHKNKTGRADRQARRDRKVEQIQQSGQVRVKTRQSRLHVPKVSSHNTPHDQLKLKCPERDNFTYCAVCYKSGLS